MNQIKNKISNYKHPYEFKNDFLQLFKNAKTYNVETSQIYVDAAHLQVL